MKHIKKTCHRQREQFMLHLCSEIFLQYLRTFNVTGMKTAHFVAYIYIIYMYIHIVKKINSNKKLKCKHIT